MKCFNSIPIMHCFRNYWGRQLNYVKAVSLY
nr:MAG TPA: hypothetical protein [Caudoviricetes sp.]